MVSKKFAEYRRLGIAALMVGLVAVGACDDDPLDPDDPSNFGSAEVDVTTTGYEPDFVDYTVAFQGGGPVDAEPTSTTLLVGIPAGNTAIVLDTKAAHCVPDAASKSVDVAVGQTAEVAFAVACSAITGSLTPTVTQTGDPLDFDPTLTVTTDDDMEFEVNTLTPEEVFHLTPGDRELTLSNIAPNCTTTDTTVAAPIVAGQPNPAAFTLDCVPNLGSVELTVTVSGTDMDNSFDVVINEGTPVTVAPGVTNIPNVRAGTIEVVLEGVADNCTVNPANATRTGVVLFGGTTPAPAPTAISFAVTCTAAG